MILLALLLLVTPPATPDPSPCSALETSYAQMDIDAIVRLHLSASSQPERFLCLYRLFPLTRDASLLDDLPRDLDEDASARDLALLAALWSYRIETAGLLGKMTVARRIVNLLDRARERGPLDPYVLLVEGQSLLYRPKIAGGGADKALDRFRALRSRVGDGDACGISRTEVDAWIWFTLAKMDDPGAGALRDRLLAQNPPPLFRQFLTDPP